MLANVEKKEETVVDARSYGRFVGAEPEPRPGLRGGHIPGKEKQAYALHYLTVACSKLMVK